MAGAHQRLLDSLDAPPGAVSDRIERNVGERDRPDTEGDIEFEFFDDPPTSEARPGEVAGTPRPDPGAGRGSERTPTQQVRRAQGGTSPTLRLALLVAGLIVLAIIIAIAVTSCGGGKKAEYEDYLGSVTDITVQSDAIGEQTNTVLFSRAIPSELRAQLQGLATQHQQLTERTLALDVPDDLPEQHKSLVTTMQLRTNGLAGLAQAFGQLGDLGTDEEAGRVLAAQASRLTASDVVYADLFEGPVRTTLAEQDIQGVEVPSSVFVSDPETYTQSTMTELVSNLGGESSGGGLRGTSLISVTAQPADLQLSPNELNQLVISTDLAFEVVLRNSGEVQLTDVRVRLTLQQDGGPIRQTKTIDVLNPDQERIVTFTDFADVNIAEPSNLIVSVPPVEGETNLDNNSASFQIIISLS